jgi:hypothetical protein
MRVASNAGFNCDVYEAMRLHFKHRAELCTIYKCKPMDKVLFEFTNPVAGGMG